MCGSTYVIAPFELVALVANIATIVTAIWAVIEITRQVKQFRDQRMQTRLDESVQRIGDCIASLEMELTRINAFILKEFGKMDTCIHIPEIAFGEFMERSVPYEGELNRLRRLMLVYSDVLNDTIKNTVSEIFQLHRLMGEKYREISRSGQQIKLTRERCTLFYVDALKTLQMSAKFIRDFEIYVQKLPGHGEIMAFDFSTFKPLGSDNRDGRG